MKQHESADNSQGQLYIVPTPIGNLSDITQRALEVLQAVDLIAAEDTRHTGLLLQHFAINARLFALHDHNEQQKAETLLAKLKEGQNIALVSDAGTPLINDPGYHLVRTCREANIRVVPLPGPCAAIAALRAAGLPSDRISYEGFLPAKSKGRRDTLKALEEEPRTLIFYESTHRLVESLEDICAVLGESRYVVLARELTKTWESIHGAPIGELVAWVKEDENRRKGEMELNVEGIKAQEESLPAAALRAIVGMKLGQVSQRLACHYGITTTLSESLFDALTEACLLPDTGARNVDSLLNQQILPALSQQLLSHMAAGQKPRQVTLGYHEEEGVVMAFDEGTISDE